MVTSTLVYEGDGRWREYEGGVEDWLTQSQRAALWAQAGSGTRSASAAPISGADSPLAVAPQGETTSPRPTKAEAPSRGGKKLSYKEQRELEGLPAKMETLEQEQAALRLSLTDPDMYVRDPLGAARMHERDAAIEEELMQCLERWEELSS